MKITRQQLRRLISETIEDITEMKDISSPVATAMTRGVSVNKKAGMVLSDSRDKIIDALRAGDTYKKKPYYVLITDENEFNPFRGTGDDVETKKRLKGLFMLGDKGSTGDPYTYQEVSGGKLKVISGPNAKAIGAVFKPREEKESIKDKLGGLAQSTSQSSSDAAQSTSDAVSVGVGKMADTVSSSF